MSSPAVDNGGAGPLVSLTLTAMSYGKDAPVLGALNLTLNPGETLAITGPSGVGKSTLLRIIAGLEPRFEGQLTAPHRIGMVFQDPALLPWRTAIENITLPTRASLDQAYRLLERVGLSGLANRYPHELSLGQQRRLALARAFVSDPQVMLLDEPFVSLDPKLASDMMALFEELRAETDVATILVSHAPDEAARLASRMMVLAGSPATIAA
ncbi:MAG: ABC transporter ATP-binding protein [Maritimibacter sp.]